VHEHWTFRKELNLFKSANEQNPKMNKNEEKEQTVPYFTWGKSPTKS
jgi:hypothetical protein